MCADKPVRKKQITEADKFRWTSLWQRKRMEIKQRDLYLCQICIRELYNTITKYNTEELEVHHNVPINEDYDKRLDNDNLLTVCNFHHEMCESGEIPREVVQQIINEQERKISPL
jgi:5-methylcytosine-specific restriction endonuclease McrA